MKKPDSNHHVVGIIQARMSSARLPGKSLMPLAGRPLVYRILERVKRAKEINSIILAIPDTSENDVLQELAEELNINTFRGSEVDVLDRYYQAALIANADYIVRIPADNPVSEPIEIDRIILHHLNLNRRGFSSNLAQIGDSGYPDGIGAEIFDFSLLREAWENNHEPEKREHVHLNFFNYDSGVEANKEWCPTSTINCPKSYARPDLILDINEMHQYQYFKKMYDELYIVNPNFGIADIIKWHDENNSKSKEIQNV